MLLIALTCLLCGIVTAQTNWWERYANMDGVTKVYISKTMLRMMPAMSFQGNLNMKELAGRLSGILILTTDREDLMGHMRREARSMADNKAYEVLMSIKDEDEFVHFYIRRKSEQRIAELVMVVEDSDEFVLIQMMGDMTMDDIKKMTKGMSLSY